MRAQVAAIVLPVIHYVFVYAIAATLLHVVVLAPVPFKLHALLLSRPVALGRVVMAYRTGA
jgi:uncharacterized membrane protein